MAGQDPRIRTIKIETGVLKRLGKELNMYKKEVVDQQSKVEKMVAEGKDEYDIKKQKEVLEESRSMIPDVIRRLKKSIEKMTGILDNEADLNETEEYQVASTELKEKQEQLEKEQQADS